MTEEIKLIRVQEQISWEQYRRYVDEDNQQLATKGAYVLAGLWVILLVGFLFFA